MHKCVNWVCNPDPPVENGGLVNTPQRSCAILFQSHGISIMHWIMTTSFITIGLPCFGDITTCSHPTCRPPFSTRGLAMRLVVQDGGEDQVLTCWDNWSLWSTLQRNILFKALWWILRIIYWITSHETKLPTKCKPNIIRFTGTYRSPCIYIVWSSIWFEIDHDQATFKTYDITVGRRYNWRTIIEYVG